MTAEATHVDPLVIELRRVRRKCALSQAAMGRLFGTDRMTIARWEHGVVPVTHRGLVRIALAHLEEQEDKRYANR